MAEVSTLDTPVKADYEALRSAIAYRRFDERLVVRMSGDDRISFLHGMCTADVKGLKPGDVAWALLLTEHAHVITDLNVFATDDALLIEIDRARWPGAKAQLEKLLVADDVEMTELENQTVLELAGPERAQAVAALFGESAAAMAPWHFTSSEAIAAIANFPRDGVAALTIIVERAASTEIVRRLSQTRHAREVSADALEIVRVEQGIARVGVDTGDKTIALEARLDPAISFTKGCYLGQETIERATSRGALKKKLYGLQIDGERAPERGAPVTLEGKEIGRVGSVAVSPARGVLALSILHHSAWTPGAKVRIEDSHGELAATISDLPFK